MTKACRRPIGAASSAGRAIGLSLAALLLAAPGVVAAQGVSDPAVVARGKYLALAADCGACHTADASKPMAGGVAVPTPFGLIYAPNITPEKASGIGAWSDNDFVRAMHQGIGKQGENLYPAFPYEAFTLLSRDDVLAIKAYLFSLKPIHNIVPANDLSFPFNQRWILWGWKLFNFRDARFHPETGRSAQWNRGAYLVEALEHCGTCHTPRNITLGLERDRNLAGGAAGAWDAFNITPDKTGGIGAWSDSEVFQYLATGATPGKAWAAGPMAEAVQNSLSQIDPDDLHAIIAYLRTQRPIATDEMREPRFAFGKPATYEFGLRGTTGLTADARPVSGAELYSANCASCHGVAGTGSQDGYFPPLVHNSALGAERPNNLLLVILDGVHRRTPHEDAFMAGFSDLSDDQVISLANYLEQQFGNPDVHVSQAELDVARRGLGRVPTGLEVAAGLVLALPASLLIGLVLVWRRRARAWKATTWSRAEQ